MCKKPILLGLKVHGENSMKKIKDMPKRERPREKLLAAGAQSLSDTELLAIILGRGTQKHDVLSLARKLIKIIDEKGLNIDVQEIMSIDGIGHAKASTIAAAFEFARRRISGRPKTPILG